MNTVLLVVECISIEQLIPSYSCSSQSCVLCCQFVFWAFRKKRQPSGEVRKHKARLCVRGNKQTPDVDFAVRRRTRFVILAKTALSTMEAEVSALAHCVKKLVGITDLAKFFASYYELEPVETKINVTVHEDESGE